MLIVIYYCYLEGAIGLVMHGDVGDVLDVSLLEGIPAACACIVDHDLCFARLVIDSHASLSEALTGAVERSGQVGDEVGR